jgi:hypothetical protein
MELDQFLNHLRRFDRPVLVTPDGLLQHLGGLESHPLRQQLNS